MGNNARAAGTSRLALGPRNAGMSQSLALAFSWLVVPAGSAPAFLAYRASVLLLDDGTVMVRAENFEIPT
jgi:hypothetical protein